MRQLQSVSMLSTLLLLTACSPASDNKVASAPQVQALTALPAIAPAMGSSFVELARSALAQGEVAAALPLAQRAVEAAPDDRDANSLLAETLLGSGRADEAEAIFIKLMAANDSDMTARTGRAMALLAMGHPETAKAELIKVVAAKPPLPVLSNAGLALALAGDPQAAVAALAPVAFATDGTPQLRQNYALALTLAGDRATAYKVAEFDLGPSRGMAQVNDWYLNADKPLPQQLAALTGLPSQSGAKPAQMAAAALPAPVAAPATTLAAPAVASSMAQTVSPVVAAAAVAQPVVAKSAPKMIEVAKAMPAAAAPVATIVSEAPVNLLPEVPTPTPATKVAAIKTPDTKPVMVRSTAKVEKANIMPVTLRPLSSKRAGFNAASAAPAASRGWLVQVAAVSATVSARDLKARLRQQFGAWMAKLGPVTHSKAEVGQRSFKRVFVGPYRSRAQAGNICARIKSRGGNCLVRAAASPATPPETKI